MLNKKEKLGQVMIELLVAMGLAAILLPAILTGFISSREGRVQAEQRSRAINLAKEGVEAVRNVREDDWLNIATNGIYHPQMSANTWTLVSGSETVDGFTRTIEISDLTPVDPSEKKITVMVNWSSFLPGSVIETIYLSRYLNNTIFTQTSVADFDAGTDTNTHVVNNNGGEVELAAGGKADWCAPNLSIAAHDLPKSGVANAISAIEGRVFAGTGDNASGVSFANVTISDTDPPVASVVGTSDGFKTNGIFGEAGYVYLATDNNFKEIEIVDLGTNPYSEAGYFNVPGNGNGSSIYVVGNTGYMASNSTFYTFDLSSKSGSRSVIGSTTLAGTGNKIYIVGNYAYVSVNSTTVQMEILDISNSASPSVVGDVRLSAAEGVDVYVNTTGTRAYLATKNSATRPELFVIDITTKTGTHTSIGSYESNGMNPKGVTVVPGNRALLVGTGAEEYQSINISDETALVRCGGLNIDAGVNGISSVLEVDGDAYSYIITGDTSSELKIIEGGPGGKFSQSGVFESSTFDAGKNVSFNRYIATVATPNETSASFKFAAAQAVSGSCANANYVYGITYTTASGMLNISGQCFRYKVFLNSNNLNATPTFSDMTVNYSP